MKGRVRQQEVTEAPLLVAERWTRRQQGSRRRRAVAMCVLTGVSVDVVSVAGGHSFVTNSWWVGAEAWVQYVHFTWVLQK